MAVTRRTKQELIDIGVAATAKLGRDFGQQQFCNATHVKLSEIKYHFGDFGPFREALGLSPNELTVRLPDEEIFADYAKICLHLAKIPGTGQFRKATRELNTRTHTVYTREPGGMAAFQKKFREWLAAGDDERKAILSYGGWAKEGQEDATDTLDETNGEPHFHPFLPGCLQYLEVLARGDMPPYESSDLSVSTLFERRTADAFKCLGFEIQQLGQGAGRNADSLACAPRERVALIIDAKVRANGYVLGTEDRKFLDYAIKHGTELQHQGFEHLYFVVVGPSFREADLTKLAEYLANTAIRSVAMITARALMRMVEDSIRNRSRFCLSDISKEMFGNKIIMK